MIPTASLLPDPPAHRREEEQLQRAVVQYLRWALPGNAEFFHIPNGGLRSKVAAARLAAMGTKAGVPDLEIVWNGKPPIFIELKTKDGSLMPVQRQMHGKLIYCGAELMVCRSLPEVYASLRELGVKLQAEPT